MNEIESGAFHALSYGLFVLTAREGSKDNGCIINTCMQLTDAVKRVSIAVNKNNYTEGMIARTGKFNANVLSTETPFKVFQHFGFQSGRDVNKFETCDAERRTENGLLYLPKYANAVLSGEVEQKIDLDTHTLFIAKVTEAHVLSKAESATYAYYFANIKPRPEGKTAGKRIKGWVCRICGFVYEGETLPADFICPICGHGADDFEPVYE